MRFDGESRRLRVDIDDTHALLRVSVHDGERRWRLVREPAYRPADEAGATIGDRILAPMPGRIVLLKANVGDTVDAQQEVLVMEAMKMELTLKAPRAGVIAEIRVGVGDFVEADAALVVLGDAA